MAEIKVSAHRRGNTRINPFRRRARKGSKKKDESNNRTRNLAIGAALGVGALALSRQAFVPKGKPVGSGRQGKVFRLGNVATKVYKKPKLAKKEFSLLKDLADTGVTPKPISIKGNQVKMEAVGGSNLGDAFKNNQFSTDASLSNLAASVSDSIKSIHEKGIVHGDLGLDNIIIDKTGKLRIIDLGMGFKPKQLNPNTDLEEISSAFNVLLRDDKRKAKLFSDTLYRRYFNL